MLSMMSRKKAALLTFATFMVVLTTTTVLWIQNAEADPSLILTVNATHACIDDTTTYPQNDICEMDTITFTSFFYPVPHPDEHETDIDEVGTFTATHVTSCSQCDLAG